VRRRDLARAALRSRVHRRRGSVAALSRCIRRP
jgi:hypothetical protein